MSDIDATRTRFDWRKASLALGLALTGGVVGFIFARFTKDLTLGWEDGLAVLVGLACLLSGLAAVVAIRVRPRHVPTGCAWMQVATLVLAGVLLLLPMLAPPSWPAWAVFAVVALLLVLQTAANLVFWRMADELFRRVIVETGAVCFWVLQAILFLYAAAERLGLVATVSGWGLMGLMMAAYVLFSCWVSLRRGVG